MTAANEKPWRVGRKVGRTIYDATDKLIGMMDTPELAALVTTAVNRYLSRAQPAEAVDEAVTLLREVYDHGENFELHERIRVFLGIKD